MPDISLMLPLCEEFQISVNELLTGEKIPEVEFKARAEKNVMDVLAQYKKKTIMRVLDIGAILENTEKRNNDLTKKGIFNTKIVKQEEGKV